MANIYPSLPRLSVKDSFDDEDLTDIDDEVFIRDGKISGGKKINDDGGVKRPLMAPRRKAQMNFKHQKISSRALLLPICYGLMALVILLGLIPLCVIIINIFPVPLNVIQNFFPAKVKSITNATDIPPCTSLASNVVWVKTLPKLTSEAPLRSLDVNNDNIDDIIIGFSTGLDTLDAPSFLCNLYFNKQPPCLGGILALNGKNGETLWTHWTEHAIFSIDCAQDINDDKIKDCIITGRDGILHVINGHDGSIIWQISIKDFPNEEIVLNVYDARFIDDVDDDNIGDVIASHTIQAGNLRFSEIVIFSGKKGDIIKTVEFSKHEQLFIAPQILIHPDGEIIYLLSSSTSVQLQGGLYIISQTDFLYTNLANLKTLQHGSGILLAPILVDVTLDGTADIIVSSLNSKITAYDGLTFELIWNYTVPDSKVISIPIPGYYNDDSIPDIMVKHQIDPIYSLSTILDGRTGKPLLEEPIKDSGNGQMSGLSLSVDGSGNDWFLYWSANCLNHDNMEYRYHFSQGQTLLSVSHANLCRLKFNTTLNTRLMAMSQHIGPPGQSLYFSKDWKSVELNNSIDYQFKKSENRFDSILSTDEINNGMENGPMMAQQSSNILRINSVKDEKYPIVVDNDDDDDGNDKKNIYSNYGTDFKPKMSNDFPDDELDWNTLRLENNVRYNEPSNDNLKHEIEQNEFVDASLLERKKRNLDSEINQSIQRQPQTGLILPSLSNNSNKVSVDLIFSTYWLPPSKVSLLQQDLECIRIKEEKAMRKLTLYERENNIEECLADRGINYQSYKEKIRNENTNFGQMTVYRIKLECICPDDLLSGQSCKNISIHQRWPAHLGQSGDGYFLPFLK
ncbi:uncharacterized protein [Chelonus insularis]|uniref:uncharacterized protein n=1 Tax=Chelonus insularis TaxID=460826 RepID=UPI00158DE5BD|nr:uncharacterized protein LOC118064515 [Chelonus insularis]XP_034935074.1 uncharacterized protein LOC118064515 [Chelonus insularis]